MDLCPNSAHSPRVPYVEVPRGPLEVSRTYLIKSQIIKFEHDSDFSSLYFRVRSEVPLYKWTEHSLKFHF